MRGKGMDNRNAIQLPQDGRNSQGKFSRVPVALSGDSDIFPNKGTMKDSSTVLLVEDDLNDIFLVKRAFKRAEISNPLQIVTDGEKAIDYLEGRGVYADRDAYPLPKLIVMDIKMPGKSGFEVLEWLKGDGQPLRKIPIVIVSSSDHPQDVNRAYELGANAYMVKPMEFRAVEHLFQSITHYWGLECAKPELEPA
jgi:CheY-like chemotaxis protein